MKPNLFEFATSELSQDAFFCWLISHAEEKIKSIEPEIHFQAKKFIRLLAEKNSSTSLDNLIINSIKIERQFKKN